MRGPTDAAVAAPRTSPRRRSWRTLATRGIRDLVANPRLVRFLVGADLKRTHQDTIVGRVWWVLDPLLQLAVYFVLVGIIFQRDLPDFALFLFAAILPWKWFSTTINDATLSITGHESLIRQISFPKIILPAASTVAGLVSFGFGLVALALVYVFFLDRVSAWLLLIPVIAAVQFLFTLALAILFAAANAFYRDVQNILRHALRLWFYLSPALYALDQIGNATVRQVLALNPFAVLFDAYRRVIYGTTSPLGGPTAPDWAGLAILTAVSLVVLVIAVALFKRAEPSFAKIL